MALSGQSTVTGFLLGLLTGAIGFSGTLYWITNVMAEYGGLETGVAVLVNLALIAYLSLYPAVFGAIVARLTRTGGRRLVLAAPWVWVASELGRTYILFTGFPWVLLGYSQVSVLPVAQLASLLGVYGVSALVVTVSAAAAYAVLQEGAPRPVAADRVSLGGRYGPLAVTLLLTAAIAGWGALRVRSGRLTREGESVRVGLLQGNVAQEEKHDPRSSARVFAEHLDLSRRAIAAGARLVIWPEASTPFPFGENLPASEQIRALARDSRVPLIIGSDQIVRAPALQYFNSAFLVRDDGSTGGVYQKMHLVPFGEYVPARKLLFFAERLVASVSDFSAGETLTLLPVGGRPVSVAICYEVVYPDEVRRSVAAGSELLTTITNDAWFGPSSAPYQHFAQASMRAIENGRYLVRAANTGITGIVDPYGRVLARTGLFEQTVVVGEARYVNGRTLYTRIGDLVAYASVLATAVLLVVTRRSYRMN